MPELSTVLVGAVATVVGAALGAWGRGYAADVKIRALEVEYSQRLRSEYLANAREYTNSVYIPLAIIFMRFRQEFEGFRTGCKGETEQEKFRETIDWFLREIQSQEEAGAAVFQTVELSETVAAFKRFQDRSRDVEASRTQMLVSLKLSMAPFFSGLRLSRKLEVPGGPGSFRAVSMDFLPFSYSIAEVVEAPICSDEYEERFLRDTRAVELLIKEVTLGARTSGASQQVA